MIKKMVLPVVGVLLLLCGCVREEVGPRLKDTGYGADAEPKNGKFEPIRNAQLVFLPLGPQQFKPGEAAEVSFALRNDGLNTVKIPEWRANEVDNVKLYCQVWLPGTEKPDENAWLAIDDEVKTPEKRFRLELRPGNQAVVRKPLTFIENLVVTPGSERRYFLKAELNLTSVKGKTDVFAIAVSEK